ncbi:MAG TPA: glycosyltransferase family 2 protein [Streptosporangiaceae bacterium]|jgi:GT2 family glycosyltransferase|nr:glycosyltransferase family 2 protein [Streptosporangiaceae bacterium]
MPPDVAVVIVTHNSRTVVGGLLDSLPAALDGCSGDVVVVDNGSADGTAAYLAARGDCRVVTAANDGYAAGINRGVRAAAAAPAILVLNPDVRLHPKAVPPLLAALAEPGVGIVAPQVRSPHGGLELSLRRKPTLARALGLTRTRLAVFSEYVHGASWYARPCTVDWALGAVLLMSRACYDLLGGWDESFFLYSEETDLALRARDLGLRTRYEPRSIAVHIGGGSGRSAATHAMQIVNRVRLYRRRHGPVTSWCYYWLAVASELSRVPRGHRESWFAARTLLRPSLRPAELRCSRRIMPQ